MMTHFTQFLLLFGSQEGKDLFVGGLETFADLRLFLFARQGGIVLQRFNRLGLLLQDWQDLNLLLLGEVEPLGHMLEPFFGVQIPVLMPAFA